jgi:hypothetical protein
LRGEKSQGLPAPHSKHRAARHCAHFSQKIRSGKIGAEKAEAQMSSNSNSEHADAAAWSPAERRGARHVATMLGLFHLCRQSRCRKAQACCGEPRACLARHAATIPQPVREFAIAMLDAQSRGFDETAARERFAPGALAHAAWLAGLAAADILVPAAKLYYDVAPPRGFDHA